MPLTLFPAQLSQRSQFYQQLGQLLAAGITVVNALEMLLRNPPARSYREPIKQMLTQISQGTTLTEAMRSLGTWTPTFDLALVQAGEHSGRLDVIFGMLATHYAERSTMMRQLISDLAYPAFLLHFAVFIFAMISWFNNGTTAGFVMHTVGILVPLYVIVFFMIYAAQSRRGIAWRALMETIMRPIPVLGSARHSLALARLCAALEALINAGVRIIEAWELAAAASGSQALYRTVTGWRLDLSAGRTPADVVNASSQFPEVFRNLYRTGEVSGQLDETLRRLHLYYQEEGTRKMHTVSRWVPIFIYLCVAGVIAFKVISFYMGYFNSIKDAGGF
jgi:type II secretory pathway component PulF